MKNSNPPFASLRLCVSLCLLLSLFTSANAQQAQISAKQNPQIEKILSEISAANIEANVRKLVSFGIRCHRRMIRSVESALHARGSNLNLNATAKNPVDD
jgi:hypothetical protein